MATRVSDPETIRSRRASVWRHLPRAGACGLALLAGSGAVTVPARSQTAPAPPALENLASSDSGSAEARRVADERAARRQAHEAELERLRAQAQAAAEARARLEGEAASLKADRARLNQALIDTTARIRDTEERAAAAEARLRMLAGSQEAIRASLEARRAVIAEVLAALQRLGRRPPPAVLVAPEDMLASVRAAILLGAVVPDLRQEAEVLVADLTELARLSEAVRVERERLAADLGTLAGERNRLSDLVAARQERIAEAERAAGTERERIGALAGQARDLKDLIDALDREASVANRAAEAARKALEEQTRETRERLAAASARDPARLSPRVAFADLRGRLPQPASGVLLRGFGEPDGSAGGARGALFSTRPAAIVAAPADGWVAFAGPFRSYGRVVILNAGSGYHVLLAGLDRIDVAVGQFVLAGEPLGAMGEATGASPAVLNYSPPAAGGETTGERDRTGPLLYVEFRRDGIAVDPAPFWARPPATRSLGMVRQDEKARG